MAHGLEISSLFLFYFISMQISQNAKAQHANRMKTVNKAVGRVPVAEIESLFS